jgi:hypothetical protein
MGKHRPKPLNDPTFNLKMSKKHLVTLNFKKFVYHRIGIWVQNFSLLP